MTDRPWSSPSAGAGYHGRGSSTWRTSACRRAQADGLASAIATAGSPSSSPKTSAIADADAILVPALAVDRDGHRLGRGGGHYDRTLAMLAGLHSTPALIALIYDDELLPAVPFDELDQLVTAFVTPGSGLSQLGG